MDIAKLIQDQGTSLIQQLTTKAGFSPEQAKAFVPKLVTKGVELFKGGGLDPKSLTGPGGVGGLIGKIGIGDLARDVGIDVGKATEGAKVTLPGVIQAIQKQAGGAAGDLARKAGGLFGGS
jgi:hypothetical protein